MPAVAWAQSPTPTLSPPNEIETLRQQVQTLTQTVQALQQQVKAQQETLAKMNNGVPPSPAPENTANNAATSPTPTASPTSIFPTTDESVVATAPEPTPLPSVTS